MDGEFLLKILQLYGFPALMCLWFMLRCERRLDAIEKSNHKQLVVMAVLVRMFGTKKDEMKELPENFADEVTGVNIIPFPASAEEKKR